MALLISMYMGLKTIYLTGTDHDDFRSGEYKYFYVPTVLRGKDLLRQMNRASSAAAGMTSLPGWRLCGPSTEASSELRSLMMSPY